MHSTKYGLPRLIRSTTFFAAILLGVASTWSDASAYTLKTLYSFCAQTKCADGQAPHGRLTMDAAGNLFGTTAGGGDSVTGDGVLFEMAYDLGHQSWTYRRLYSFCSLSSCADGSDPTGNLIVDNRGNIYGTTRFGGYGAGTIFELTPKGET